MYRLECYDNQLSTLDISKNPYLYWLVCSNNQLTSLDITQNTALEILNCDYNQLSSLNISNNNIDLSWINCSNNQFTSLSDFVTNEILGFGDYLDVRDNFIGCFYPETTFLYIQILQDRMGNNFMYEPQKVCETTDPVTENPDRDNDKNDDDIRPLIGSSGEVYMGSNIATPLLFSQQGTRIICTAPFGLLEWDFQRNAYTHWYNENQAEIREVDQVDLMGTNLEYPVFLSENQKYLFAYDVKKQLIAWNSQTHEVVRLFNDVDHYLYHQNGNMLLVKYNNAFEIIDINTWNTTGKISIATRFSEFSYDGTYVIILNEENVLYCIHAIDGNILWHQDGVFTFENSPTKNHVLIQKQNNLIELYTMENQELINRQINYNDLMFSDGGRYLYAIQFDLYVLIDLEENNNTHIFDEGKILSFSSNDQYALYYKYKENKINTAIPYIDITYEFFVIDFFNENLVKITEYDESIPEWSIDDRVNILDIIEYEFSESNTFVLFQIHHPSDVSSPPYTDVIYLDLPTFYKKEWNYNQHLGKSKNEEFILIGSSIHSTMNILSREYTIPTEGVVLKSHFSQDNRYIMIWSGYYNFWEMLFGTDNFYIYDINNNTIVYTKDLRRCGEYALVEKLDDNKYSTFSYSEYPVSFSKMETWENGFIVDQIDLSGLFSISSSSSGLNIQKKLLLESSNIERVCNLWNLDTMESNRYFPSAILIVYMKLV